MACKHGKHPNVSIHTPHMVIPSIFIQQKYFFALDLSSGCSHVNCFFTNKEQEKVGSWQVMVFFFPFYLKSFYISEISLNVWYNITYGILGLNLWYITYVILHHTFSIIPLMWYHGLVCKPIKPWKSQKHSHESCHLLSPAVCVFDIMKVSPCGTSVYFVMSQTCVLLLEKEMGVGRGGGHNNNF